MACRLDYLALVKAGTMKYDEIILDSLETTPSQRFRYRKTGSGMAEVRTVICLNDFLKRQWGPIQCAVKRAADLNNLQNSE